jgi:membrane protease YdiL (CAAX protease family)
LPFPQVVTLHLLPGAVQMGAYAVFAPVLLRAGAPRTLAFLAAVLLAGLPCMVAVLFWARRRRSLGQSPLRPVVGNREPMPVWQYVVLFVPLLALAFGLLFATAPLNRFLAEEVFFWLPGYLQPEWQPPAPPARALVLLGLALQVVIDGIAAPVTEEVYFRGFLLPRMRSFGCRRRPPAERARRGRRGLLFFRGAHQSLPRGEGQRGLGILTTPGAAQRMWTASSTDRESDQRWRAIGRVNVNRAPLAKDSAQIFPPWASMIPLAM